MRSPLEFRNWRQMQSHTWSLAQSRLDWIRGHQRVTKESRPDSTLGSDRLDPAQCAFVGVDLQPEVLDSVPDSSALIFTVNSVISTVRRSGGHTCFVRTAFDDLDYRFVPSTSVEFSRVARERRFQNGTLAAGLHPAIATESEDTVVRKTRLSAFSTTDLDERLTNLGITALILVGAHTSGAILSTVRDAADRDYRVIIIEDCTRDQDRDIHDLLVAKVLPRQAEVISSGSLHARLTRGSAHIDAGIRLVP